VFLVVCHVKQFCSIVHQFRGCPIIPLVQGQIRIDKLETQKVFFDSAMKTEEKHLYTSF